MSFNITFTACGNERASPSTEGLLKWNPSLHLACGDFMYIDRDAVRLNGITLNEASGNPGIAAGQFPQWKNRYDQQILGKSWKPVFDRRSAKQLRIILQGDDHDWLWNNWDNSLGRAPNDLTPNTVAQMWSYRVLADNAMEPVFAAYFDNPARPFGGFVPDTFTAAGVGSSAQARIYYFSEMLDANGTVTTDPAKASVMLVYTDCVHDKDTQTDADSGADFVNAVGGVWVSGPKYAKKKMWGNVQFDWFKAQVDYCKKYGIHMILPSSKDWWNLDNSDGWRSYPSQRSLVWSHIETSGIGVTHITGDRHTPHSSYVSTAQGSLYNGYVHCACPFGSNASAMTPYPENDWWDTRPSAIVYGVVEVDTTARIVRVRIVDAHTDESLLTTETRFGERLPYKITKADTTKTAQIPKTPVTSDEVAAYFQGLVAPMIGIQANLPVYVGLWANRPAATLYAAPAAGLPAARAFFTDAGPTGSWWRSDGSFWVQEAPVRLFGAAGTLAAPLATLANVASGTFAAPGSIPAGMFVKPGMRMEVLADFARSTAVAAGTVNFITGQALDAFTVSAVANQHVRMHTSVYAVTSGTQMTEQWLPGNVQNAAAFVDKSINFATAVPLTITLSGAGVTDSYTLLSYSLTLHPA